MSGFVRDATGAIAARFEPQEASILTDLAGQLAELVEDRGAPGSDPALDRLLPDGYRESAVDAAEFRRFTESDLARQKVRNARTVIDSLTGDSAAPNSATAATALGESDIAAWLRTLTDLRLTLAARLAVERDGSMPEDADEMTAAVYEWLGYLQESLLDAIDR
jgi:hypothetical protein